MLAVPTIIIITTAPTTTVSQKQMAAMKTVAMGTTTTMSHRQRMEVIAQLVTMGQPLVECQHQQLQIVWVARRNGKIFTQCLIAFRQWLIKQNVR